MQKDLLLKQLKYRSNHRGCKETDVLLGNFFNEKFSQLSDDELEIYRHFIEEDDMLIYDWILGKAESENKYQTLILEIRKFHKIYE